MQRFLLLLVVICSCVSLTSQVTIGSDLPPVRGALLDLKTDTVFSNRGLGLPRVLLKDIRTQMDLGKTMGASEDGTLDPKTHVGLMVYNVGKNEESERTRFCPGLHVWDGNKWLPLSQYAEIKVGRFPIANTYKRSFEYLNPSSSLGWPKDRETARAIGKYALGRNVSQSPSSNGTDDISDLRPGETSANIYTVSRFYVGNKIETEDVEVKKSYLCDASLEPVWDESNKTIVTDTIRTFDEGVWMTQNLRALKMPDGSSLSKNTSSPNPNLSAPLYYLPNNASSLTTANSVYGVLYNWAAALGVGKPSGPATLPANVNEGGSTNRDVTYQGICPEGWYLPSDQEWTDLANGIVKNVTMFANVLQSSVSPVSYDLELDMAAGGALGQAMKSTKVVSIYSTGGQSKAYDMNGFDIYLVGTSGSAIDVRPIEYGNGAYFWTSSRIGSSQTDYPIGYIRQFKYNSTGYFRTYHDGEQTFSVRCKKITN